MKDGRLDQLNKEFIEDLVSKDYAIKHNFVYDTKNLQSVYERLELLEIEGKF